MTHEFHFNPLHMARTLASVGACVLAGCLLSAMSLMTGLAVASDPGAPAIAAAAGDGAGAGILFDIPSQPLRDALDAFATATGFSGLYSVQSTAGRRSVPVRGRYTPDAALRMLIENTGLVVQYTAADAFILEPGESASASKARDAYDGLLQSNVRDAFCRDSRLASGDYRLAMTFRINAQGQLEQPLLLSSTGDAARDNAVLAALREIRLARPPADPSQPYTMLILPGALAAGKECKAN